MLRIALGQTRAKFAGYFGNPTDHHQMEIAQHPWTPPASG
jgi:hypothetical protein